VVETDAGQKSTLDSLEIAGDIADISDLNGVGGVAHGMSGSNLSVVQGRSGK
jgi:hypothetical protein